MTGFIVLLFIALIGMIITVCVTDISGTEVFIISLCTGLATAAISGMIAFKNPQPTAMDVYRNKTELQITYRDTVAIDSTVVFKNIK